MMRGDQTPAWAALRAHFDAQGSRLDLRDAFAADPTRFADFSLQAPEVFADLSKNLLDRDAQRLLLALAQACGLPARRDAMFAGAPINATEGRAVLHVALRAPHGRGPWPADLADEVDAVRERMLALAERVRDTAASGITDVVNIGIGGSDLGPAMAVQALDGYAQRGLRLHFVSNVDGQDIARVLRGLDPRRTLFVVASKTFTTADTMANARLARAWFVEQGGGDIARHFVAATANVQAAAAFGIRESFGFRDWVGGRYSMWGAIGLPIAIAVGSANFRALLAGAHAMDRHFAQAPLARNLPVLLGLLDVWYRNFHRFTSRSVAPYHQGLARLPAYLQQLEMESNGKGVDLDGRPLASASAPVVWGEPGTNGQHAYFQLLHQGSDVIPVEFILVRSAGGNDLAAPLQPALARQHAMLLANGLAQAQALMRGKTAAQAAREQPPGIGADPALVARHRCFPGNRPSTTFVLDALTPRSLGALVALHEHRVFTSAAVWGINAFDQWGVELGKSLADDLLPRLASGDAAGLDASTAGLLARLRR